MVNILKPKTSTGKARPVLLASQTPVPEQRAGPSRGTPCPRAESTAGVQLPRAAAPSPKQDVRRTGPSPVLGTRGAAPAPPLLTGRRRARTAPRTRAAAGRRH